LGLPKSINLYTPKTEPVLQYRVIDSTNILGWRFPLEFNMAQYRPAPLPESPSITFGTNGWELEFTAKGRVTTIGIGTAPQIPAKFVKARDAATLTAEKAGLLAQQLANERAQTLYNCQPFYKAQPARFADGHWSWHQLQAQAKGDMEAKVEFKEDGAEPNVSVMRLESLSNLQ
jgi:hypothetical protein